MKDQSSCKNSLFDDEKNELLFWKKYQEYLERNDSRAFIFDHFIRGLWTRSPNFAFWEFYVNQSWFFALVSVGLNLTFEICLLGFLATINGGEYLTVLASNVCIWLVINLIVLASLALYAMTSELPVHRKQSLRIWIRIGDFILCTRLLVLLHKFFFQLKAHDHQQLPLISGYLASVQIHGVLVVIEVLINLINALSLVMQPFPWPWGLFFCILEFAGVLGILFNLRLSPDISSITLSVINHTIIVVIGMFALVLMAISQLELSAMLSLSNSAKQKSNIKDVSELISFLCTETKYPLQYILSIVNLISFEFSEKLKAEQLISLKNVTLSQYIVNNLANGFMLLTRIEEGRYNVNPETTIDLSKLLQFMIQLPEFRNHVRSNIMIINVSVTSDIVMNQNCITDLVHNLVFYFLHIIGPNLPDESQVLIEFSINSNLNVSPKPDGLVISVRCPENHNLLTDANSISIILVRELVESVSGKFVMNDEGSLNIVLPCERFPSDEIPSVRESNGSIELKINSASQPSRRNSRNETPLNSVKLKRLVKDSQNPKFCVVSSVNERLESWLENKLEQLVDDRSDYTIFAIHDFFKQYENSRSLMMRTFYDSQRATNREDSDGSHPGMGGPRGSGVNSVRALASTSGVGRSSNSKRLEADSHLERLANRAVHQIEGVEGGDANDFGDNLGNDFGENDVGDLSNVELVSWKLNRDYQAIFTGSLEFCRMLRANNFEGLIIFCSANMAYFDRPAKDTSDETIVLSIPCMDEDLMTILIRINPCDHRIATLVADGSSIHPTDVDSALSVETDSITPQTMSPPKSSQTKVVSKSQTKLGVFFTSHTNSARTSEMDSEGLSSDAGLSVSRPRQVVRQEPNARNSRSKKVVGQKFNFSVLGKFGIQLFPGDMEENFHMWRLLYPSKLISYNRSTLIFIKGLCLLVLGIITLTYYGNAVTRLSSIMLIFVEFNTAFRGFIYPQLESFHVKIGVYWKVIGWLAIFIVIYSLFLTLFDVKGNSFHIYLGEVDENSSFDQFLITQFGSSTGEDIINTFMTSLGVASAWTNYYPWPVALYFIFSCFARIYINFVFILQNLFKASNLLNIVFLLLAQHFIATLLSLYWFEVFHRLEFRKFRKQIYSQHYLENSYLIWSGDVAHPLKVISEERVAIGNIFRNLIEKNVLVLDRYLLRDWKSFVFGYHLLDQFKSILKLHESFHGLTPVLISSQAQLTMLQNEILSFLSLYVESSTTITPNIHLDFDERLSIVHIDLKHFRILLSFAVECALRNITASLRRDPRLNMYQQEIYIKVGIHEPLMREYPNLPFIDPRLLDVQILDSGSLPKSMLEINSSHFRHGFDLCKKLLVELARMQDPRLVRFARYEIFNKSIFHRPFISQQVFTFPFKFHPLSSYCSSDSVIASSIFHNKLVTNQSTLYFNKYERIMKLSMPPNDPAPTVPASATASTSAPATATAAAVAALGLAPAPVFNPPPPPNSPSMLILSSNYPENYRFQNIFLDFGWRVDLIEKLSLSNMPPSIHAYDCILIDESSPVRKIKPAQLHLLTVVRLLGYKQIIGGIFATADEPQGFDNENKNLPGLDYDCRITRIITEATHKTLVAHCNAKIVSLLVDLNQFPT